MYTAHPSHPAVRARPPLAPSLRSYLKGLQRWKLTPQRNVGTTSTRDSLKIRQLPTESCREFIDSNCFLLGHIEELLRSYSNKQYLGLECGQWGFSQGYVGTGVTCESLAADRGAKGLPVESSGGIQLGLRGRGLTSLLAWGLLSTLNFPCPAPYVDSLLRSGPTWATHLCP